MSKPPGDVSHQAVSESKDPSGNPPSIHESPGEDEKRYRQKRKGVNAHGHSLGQCDQRDPLLPEERQGRNSQGEADRHPHNDKTQHQDC